MLVVAVVAEDVKPKHLTTLHIPTSTFFTIIIIVVSVMKSLDMSSILVDVEWRTRLEEIFLWDPSKLQGIPIYITQQLM